MDTYLPDTAQLTRIERKLDILIAALAEEEDEPSGTLDDDLPVTKPIETL